MFEDILKSCIVLKNEFEDLAQDDFGRSIVNDIYAPIMDELYQLIEIDSRNKEQSAHFMSIISNKSI